MPGPWLPSTRWWPLCRALSQARCRCWIPDLPGTDQDDPSCLTVTLEDLAAAVQATIDKIDQPQDLTLLVHGLAGPVGQLITATAAHRISRIVWIDALVLDRAPGGMDHLADQLDHRLHSLVMQAERGLPVAMDPVTWAAFFTHIAHLTDPMPMTDRVCPPGWLAGEADVTTFWDQAAAHTWEQAYLHYPDDAVVPYSRQLDTVHCLRPDRTAALPGSHTCVLTYPEVAAPAILDLCRPGLGTRLPAPRVAIADAHTIDPADADPSGTGDPGAA